MSFSTIYYLENYFLFVCSLLLPGIQDENGKYLIPMPTWSSKVIYNAGTKISYSNDYESPDRLEIEGPTNMTLKIVVGDFIVTEQPKPFITLLKSFRYALANPSHLYKRLMPGKDAHWIKKLDPKWLACFRLISCFHHHVLWGHISFAPKVLLRCEAVGI